jgi:hypothetical protein
MTRAPRPRNLKLEDATRLRECLAALSEACGHDVFRLETIATNYGTRIILTCSNKTKEADIGQILALELKRALGPVEFKAGKAKDVSG